MRQPIGCFGWHVAGAGYVVVCDDGSVWRWHDEEGWMEYEPVPGTDAAGMWDARKRLSNKHAAALGLAGHNTPQSQQEEAS